MEIISSVLRFSLRILSFLLQRISGLQFWYHSRRVSTLNKRTLFGILNKAKDSEYGIEHSFPSLVFTDKLIENFKKTQKISKYEDYKQYTQKIVEGTPNVMRPGFPISISTSSGTTGEPKLIPLFESVGDFALLSYQLLQNEIPGVTPFSPKLAFVLSPVTKFTKNGIPFSPISNLVYSKWKNFFIKTRIWTSPTHLIINVPSYSDQLILHVLFSLQREDLETFFCVYSLAAYDTFRTLENNWSILIDSIQLGKLPEDKNFSKPLSADIRASLSQLLKPNFQRAQNLIQIRKKNDTFENIVPKIWPRLRCIIAINGGPMKSYTDKARFYSGDIPYFGFCYVATEALMGVYQKCNNDDVVLYPKKVYMEFIEEDDFDQEQPKTLEINQLEIGKKYEIVITSGVLYRYRLGDILQMKGYYNQLPIINFIGRKGMALRIGWFKLLEDQIHFVIEKTFEKGQVKNAEYTLIENLDAFPVKLRLVVQLNYEIENPEEKSKKLTEIFDDILAKNVNTRPDFEVVIVKQGSFEQLRDKMKSDAPQSTTKMPLLLKNPNYIKFLNNQVL